MAERTELTSQISLSSSSDVLLGSGHTQLHIILYPRLTYYPYGLYSWKTIKRTIFDTSLQRLNSLEPKLTDNISEKMTKFHVERFFTISRTKPKEVKQNLRLFAIFDNRGLIKSYLTLHFFSLYLIMTNLIF